MQISSIINKDCRKYLAKASKQLTKTERKKINLEISGFIDENYKGALAKESRMIGRFAPLFGMIVFSSGGILNMIREPFNPSNFVLSLAALAMFKLSWFNYTSAIKNAPRLARKLKHKGYSKTIRLLAVRDFLRNDGCPFIARVIGLQKSTMNKLANGKQVLKNLNKT